MSQSGDYESVLNPRRKRSVFRDEVSPTTAAEEFPVPPKPSTETTEEKGQTADIGAIDGWTLRKGHGLTFIALFFFSVVLYFRPYELIPALSSLTQMAFFFGVLTLAIYVPSQLILEGNLTARPREIHLILLLCLAAFLSMPMATSPGEAYTEFTNVLLKAIVIFIVIVNVVRTENRLKLLIWLAFAVSLYLSYYAVSDYMHGNF